MRMGGVTEVADLLGISRQRVAKLRERNDFPDPIAEIAQGPIWDLDQIQAWRHSGLRLSSGRPRSDTAARTLGGRFVLEEPRIGSGGFADVYRAADRKQTRRNPAPVAVKVLREVDDLDPEAVRRFQRELRLLEAIRHPNVVPILGHGQTTTDGIWYAMPLAQGSLADFADEIHGKNALVLDVMRQVCAGLKHIHEQAIYHRDLKPENILRLDDGVWAISDFGLAVEAERKTTTLTATLQGVGTPWFTAPEQWRDARSVNHLADIFSLGKVLQELVVGEVPVDAEMPPGPLRPVVMKATATRPEQRYLNVEDFLAALETAIEASTTRWETAEDTAKRLLQRVRLPRAAVADLNELAAWALALDEDDDADMTALVRVLPWISGRSIRHLWTVDELAFRTIFRHYSTRVETGNFSFDYCDVLAEFARRAVNETADVDVLRDAIRSLVELGYRHNRWRVRDVVTTILQAIRETEPSLAATEALQAVSRDAAEWTLTDFSVRSLPPVLRAGIENLLHALPQ
jgi:serine/threonine protein kinase